MQLENDFQKGMKKLMTEEGMQAVFELLVRHEERDWLLQHPDKPSYPTHNSDDDDMAELALDLDMGKYVDDLLFTSAHEFDNYWRMVVFPSSQTYKAFLRMNYLIYHSLKDSKLAPQDRLSPMPATQHIHSIFIAYS